MARDTMDSKHVGEVDPKNQVGEALPPPGPAPSSEPLVEYLNNVVGVFGTGEVESVVADLAANGFADSVDSFCGEEGAKRIDFSGDRHGFLGKVNRVLHWVNEDKDMRRYEAELLAGNCVVMVHADDEWKMRRALRVMRSHDGRYINHFGPLVVTELEK